MTTTNYYIEIFAETTDPRRQQLADALKQEIERLGIHRTVSINLVDTLIHGGPVVGVYFGNSKTAKDPRWESLVSQSLKENHVVIPVVSNLAAYSSSVPECLRPINGFEWSSEQSPENLCRKLLEELGIEERQRRVFISHKREDGLAAAEQLHEHLSRHGFRPFIDRFHIPAGRDVQAEIADQLEDCAMLLLLETPLAYTSDWVFDEVDYALSHGMGLHIISWPDIEAGIAVTTGLPRQHLARPDLLPQKGYDIFTPDAIDRIIRDVEAEHARAMVARRRYLLLSAEEAAQDAGRQCFLLPGWCMVVQGEGSPSIVQVTPRLPTVEDLHALDGVRLGFSDDRPGILVHAARRISESRRNVLAWAGGSRDLTLVPENAIGGYWRPDVA
jgi:hypothetical protein